MHKLQSLQPYKINENSNKQPINSLVKFHFAERSFIKLPP